MGQLYEITPFTLLDYPGEMACIAWFAGCNMRCVYCHNPQIVTGKGEKDEQDLLDFLAKRTGRLSGVVFSGGEATLYQPLPDLIRKVRSMGFKIKLDTNGSRPEVLRGLLEEGLLDYVALDYKCVPEKAEALIGTGKLWEPFRKSLAMLIEAAGEEKSEKIGFEIRTTFHADLMDEDDLARMIQDLDEMGYRGTYYIQNIASTGEKTIGNIQEPQRALDRARLPEPKNFTLAFRNFPEK